MRRRGEGIRNPTETKAAREAARDDFYNVLRRVLNTLTPVEGAVVQSFFGLLDGRCRSCEEVAVETGLELSAVRGALRRALRKLRHPSRSLNIKDFIDEGFVEISLDERLRFLGPREDKTPPVLKRVLVTVHHRGVHTSLCAYHGWCATPAENSCLICPCPSPMGRSGRPRRYCSTLCQKRAAAIRATKEPFPRIVPGWSLEWYRKRGKKPPTEEWRLMYPWEERLSQESAGGGVAGSGMDPQEPC